MSTVAHVGFSHHRNPRQAGKEAVTGALNGLNGRNPSFLLVFASVGYHQQRLIQSIREISPDVPLVGCSAEGIILNNEVDESAFSVAVMAVASDDLRFHPILVEGMDRLPEEDVGARVAAAVRACEEPEPVALFLFPDGLRFNFDQFIDGYNSVTDPSSNIPLLGGLAGDDWSYEKTYQYVDGTVSTTSVAAMLLGGPAEIVYGISHGCDTIGEGRIITRSDRNRIYELDGQPILEVLEEYITADSIDKWGEAFVDLSFGFRSPGHLRGESDYIIRSINARNEDEGWVQFNTQRELTEGSQIWMTHRNQQGVRDGAVRLMQDLHSRIDNRPSPFLLHFDCGGRGRLLFNEQDKLALIQAMQREFSDTPWMGMYVYGEICPVQSQSCFHNYTAVVAAIVVNEPQTR